VASLFQQIKAGQLWDFHGGIHPPTRKQQTRQQPVATASMPELLYVPLRQHIGVSGKLLVKTGDLVLKGQPLTAADNAMAIPVHAPTSGRIESICQWPSAHPSALPEPMIVLRPDGDDQWRPRHKLDYLHTDRAMLLARIQQAGIAGMGGAGFPTHIKSGANTGVDYLIINAVECEPYITADDVLMQHHADTIVRGIDILSKLLSPKAVLIGIEDDKTAAIAAMQQACKDKENYLVRVLPTKYPSGGEKQLIQLLTSKEVPTGRRPLDIGIVMQNVATAFAIAQAVEEDIPLLQRIVTVVGETLQQPQNMWALLGTPVQHLLTACGFTPQALQRVIMGGPMMGFTLPSLQIPVVKTTNCLLAPTDTELPAAAAEMDCIRCGACAEACPATLLPQQLLWHAKAKDHEQLKKHYLQDCIECGACSYVCPSEIPLVQYYRVAKAEIREQAREELKAEQAKARFEARKERLEKDKAERAARNQALAAQRNAMLADQQKQQIAAAAARAQASEHPVGIDKAEIIAERERKKAEARAYQAEKAAQQQMAADAPESQAVPADARQAAVAAAIARAKAKKQTETSATEPAQATQTETKQAATAASADPRQAAVAAAIARAKAKKLAEQAAADTSEAQATSEAPEATAASQSLASSQSEAAHSAEPVDPRQAAVAAAIARAKAKKLAEQAAADTSEAQATSEAPEATAASQSLASSQSEASNSAEPVDPRKAAVAAAIARAKAKKLAEQAAADTSEAQATSEAPEVAAASQSEASSQSEAPSSAEPVDPRKAAVAAAIARAKAKKLAEQTQQPPAHTPAIESASDKDGLSDNDDLCENDAANETDRVSQNNSLAAAGQAQTSATPAISPAASSPAATEPMVSTNPDAAKKAAIAAAIAKAKARQQQGKSS